MECPTCAERIPFEFLVTDEDWAAVMGGDRETMCLPCFDVAARERKVRYSIIGLTIRLPGQILLFSGPRRIESY